MTPEQAKTAKRLGFAVLFFLGWVAYLLWTELSAVAAGGDSTISEAMWRIWATQPWIVWLISVVSSFIVGFFSGHFLGQSDVVYDSIRKGQKEVVK